MKEIEDIINILHKFPDFHVVDYRKHKQAKFDRKYKAMSRELEAMDIGMVLGAILYIIAILLILGLIKIGRMLLFELLKAITR